MKNLLSIFWARLGIAAEFFQTKRSIIVSKFARLQDLSLLIMHGVKQNLKLFPSLSYIRFHKRTHLEH